MRSLRVLPLVLAAAIAVGAVAPRSAAARERTATAPLAERIASRLDQAGVRAGRLGVAVVDLDTGTLVFERGGDVALIPASVAKVATAVAVLDALGPGHRFKTSVAGRGAVDPATGVLTGDLLLVGSGDPSLSKRDHPNEPLWPFPQLAAAVRRLGIRTVTGALVLDDAPFDREYLHPTWSASDLDDWYGAPVAGLTFNDGCATVLVRGAATAGRPAAVTFPSTSGPWPVDAQARTVDERTAQVGGAFTADGRLRVFGNIGPGLEASFDAPVPDPLAFTGGAMLTALEAAGVKVAGGARPARSAADRAGATEIASVENPIAPVVRVMNRRSQNLHASLLFKAAGAARDGVGSWETGERAVAASLARRGIPAGGQRVVDGSGLSTANRLAATTLARLLASADGELLWGALLRDSLAVPGEDGTLQKRFRDVRDRTRLRAKTGTLGRTGVHALAGYVEGRAGRRGFAFAVIVNDGKVDGRAVGDDVARILLDE
jgi:D-alanyl-D-alanine carboxypeptidase/D-alanyl-D-alanine-endopeptidase (penicillin-binding protein 4)